MSKSRHSKGEVRLPAGVAIWRHELASAKALAEAGYRIEFLEVASSQRAKSPDVVMNSSKWEMKSPRADKLSAVERNLKRALKQSPNIIFDSHRMKKLHDKTIQNFLAQKLREQKQIKRLIIIIS